MLFETWFIWKASGWLQEVIARCLADRGIHFEENKNLNEVEIGYWT